MKARNEERPVSVWQSLAIVAWLDDSVRSGQRVITIDESDSAIVFKTSGIAMLVHSDSADDDERDKLNRVIHDALDGAREGDTRRRLEQLAKDVIDSEGGIDAILDKALRAKGIHMIWPSIGNSEKPKA